MCDRILVFGSNPGRILAEIAVDLTQPRNRLDPEFREVVERIYVAMTASDAARPPETRAERFPGAGIGTVLPRISSNLLSGLLEAVVAAPYDGEADLPVIAKALHMEIDDLFPVAETLQMLRFAELAGGDIRLSAEGKQFALADLDERKQLFARHLLNYVALAAHIRSVLDERPGHRAPWSRFSDELEDHMSPDVAERTLRAVISWGRFAEIFAYDDQTQMFNLENP
jgi:NitT/TauT family transport system ATP-binding protein